MRSSYHRGNRFQRRAETTLHRRTRRTEHATSRALTDDRSKHHDDFLDDCSSNALSAAVICKSACTFPKPSIVRSALSNRLASRSFSRRRRVISASSGFERHPRGLSDDASGALRQFAMCDVYTASRRRTAALSNGLFASSYSAIIRALSAAEKRRRVAFFERTSGFGNMGYPWSPSVISPVMWPHPL